MHSYETYFVREIVAQGNLPALHELLAAILREIALQIPRVRNPHRLGWLRLWRKSLSRTSTLPHLAAAETESMDREEIAVCARRVVAWEDPSAVEALLQAIADELDLTAAREANPERRVWMLRAGRILKIGEVVPGTSSTVPRERYVESHSPIGQETLVPHEEGRSARANSGHWALAASAVALLLVVGFAIVGWVIAPG